MRIGAAWWVTGQVTLALTAYLAIAAWPPATGRLWLIPLAGDDANGVARTALAGGALLLGPGPVRGSLVVEGDRAALVAQARGWRLAVLAAPPAGCGGAAATGPKP